MSLNTITTLIAFLYVMKGHFQLIASHKVHTYNVQQSYCMERSSVGVPHSYGLCYHLFPMSLKTEVHIFH
jgi:hypothetical protein